MRLRSVSATPCAGAQRARKRPRGAVREVVAAGRERRAFDGEPHARAAELDRQLVGEVDGLEDRAQLVVAVSAASPPPAGGG